MNANKFAKLQTSLQCYFSLDQQMSTSGDLKENPADCIYGGIWKAVSFSSLPLQLPPQLLYLDFPGGFQPANRSEESSLPPSLQHWFFPQSH